MDHSKILMFILDEQIILIFNYVKLSFHPAVNI